MSQMVISILGVIGNAVTVDKARGKCFFLPKRSRDVIKALLKNSIVI